MELKTMFRVNGRTPQTVDAQSKWTKMKVRSQNKSLKPTA